MWLDGFLRTQLKRLLTKQSHVALESKIPLLESRLQDILTNSAFISISPSAARSALTALTTKRFITLR